MTILATSDILNFSLQNRFGQDLGHSMILDIYAGTLPTKSELELSNIYLPDGTGWIDPSKWDAFTSNRSMDLIRRFVLNDFSKNISIEDNVVSFKFNQRDRADYTKDAHAQNQFNSGTASWFAIRSMSASLDNQHYAFTGAVSLMGEGGDMQLVKLNLTDQDLIFPSSLSIDVGDLLVM